MVLINERQHDRPKKNHTFVDNRSPTPFCVPVGRATTAFRAESAAGGETYRIIDGVRRAKAAQLTGKTTIPAKIMENGTTKCHVEIPIDKLLSPKEAIDVRSPTDMNRFLEKLDSAGKGKAPDPIEIEISPQGTPIKDVKLQRR